MRTETGLCIGDGQALPTPRAIATEAPVAVEYNGIGYAVMMMTPRDLNDFALGFSMTERIVTDANEILDTDIADVPAGTILRITVGREAATRIGDRVRHRSSDTGCGLCGIASLESLQRSLPPRPVPMPFPREAVRLALARLRDHQPLGQQTGATHAAAWCAEDGRILDVREDVGRHNALDKLIGTLEGKKERPGGFAIVTSRISFEMADKALVARMPWLVGISAPTTMALDHARRHGLGLVALARQDSMWCFSEPDQE
ncbi:formate dehydrogenase accessory sulfurtransferase FdhD [Stakelama saccharophila]|uniref:Sulfur carrier protein FdhD n=1 Tax=Stakelama saccharophila TaxID=3075605 RepID=A0ABZ0BDC6_9SPHN|nr:formate dehydrogenase accessory sulfurtransferase FdhD [Stakelama sp. W311]WNO55135.1 formate dehydrogenase accessory sulfurtransferase FdhD [Stakelama sp. W311]